MGYVSNTDIDRKEMLAAIGTGSFSELLPIPEDVRLHELLDVPKSLDENSLYRYLSKLSARNISMDDYPCFLGAGIYDHFRPAVIGALASRGEFCTAYTPYQPEMSQGMLQAIYEFQTFVCALTGMDLSNASMYDAATGLAEAALMSVSITGRSTVVVLKNVHPHYRQVNQTYLNTTEDNYIEIDAENLNDVDSSTVACVICQNPDFFGRVEDLAAISEYTHRIGAMLVVSVDPVSLALLKPPSDYDADIVVGEGQSLGNAPAFGGPLLGFFACKKKYVRSFPGRIVGATQDLQGRRGYTMTLRTREQDIRREKATSNICTNQSLLALCTTIHLSALGKHGLRQVAAASLLNAHNTADALCKIPGVSMKFPDQRYFKEFVLKLPISPEKTSKLLVELGVIGGLPLGKYYTYMSDCMLFCVTETRSEEDIQLLVDSMRTIVDKEARI